jgi:hypothetical protein
MRGAEIRNTIRTGHTSVARSRTAAGQVGCGTAAVIQGRSESWRESPDFLFRLETESVPRAVESALLFGQLLVEFVEAELFGI